MSHLKIQRRWVSLNPTKMRTLFRRRVEAVRDTRPRSKCADTAKSERSSVRSFSTKSKSYVPFQIQHRTYPSVSPCLQVAFSTQFLASEAHTQKIGLRQPVNQLSIHLSNLELALGVLKISGHKSVFNQETTSADITYVHSIQIVISHE